MKFDFFDMLMSLCCGANIILIFNQLKAHNYTWIGYLIALIICLTPIIITIKNQINFEIKIKTKKHKRIILREKGSEKS